MSPNYHAVSNRKAGDNHGGKLAPRCFVFCFVYNFAAIAENPTRPLCSSRTYGNRHKLHNTFGSNFWKKRKVQKFEVWTEEERIPQQQGDHGFFFLPSEKKYIGKCYYLLLPFFKTRVFWSFYFFEKKKPTKTLVTIYSFSYSLYFRLQNYFQSSHTQ